MSEPRVFGFFSGIGGFELGFERAGFEVASVCEIDPFCNLVLKKHWPHVPNLGDIRFLSQASHAKTFRQQVPDAALMGQNQDCGTTSGQLSKNTDPAGLLSKTAPTFDLEDWKRFSGSSMRSGMLCSGTVYRLQPLAHITAGTASGLLPTLTRKGNYNRKGASKKSGDGLATRLGGPPNPEWLEWFMGYPVGWTEPLASEMQSFLKSRRSSRKGSKSV